MSFPRYPAYKPSGVEWLGEVPAHWEVLRFSRLILAIKDGTHGTYARVSDGFPLLSAKNVLDGRLEIGESESLISEADHREITAGDFPRKGDLLLTIVGTLGRCCVYEQDEPIAFQRSVCFIRLRPENHPRFFYFVTQSQFFQEQLLGRSKSAAQAGVYMGDVAGMTILLPPGVGEQHSISDFLDRETAKIDALAAEQEQLIALLKEKRQAVISHAVTKGLDPSVPMKDSGVEWLGQVPAHWCVMPIKLAARLESGHTPSRSRPDWWVDCTVPWFSLADVWQIREAGRDVVYETKELVSELGLANSSARLLPKGTVMLSRTASVGFAAIMGVDMATTQDFANWVCGEELIPEFLLAVFRAMKPEFQRLMMGSTHNTIYMPDIQSFRFALPPIAEQRTLVAQLGTQLRELDGLVDEVVLSIELLRERRAALISAAVTGQIDVRGLTGDDQDRLQLRSLLLDGAASAPTEPVGDAYFEGLRQQARTAGSARNRR